MAGKKTGILIGFVTGLFVGVFAGLFIAYLVAVPEVFMPFVNYNMDMAQEDDEPVEDYAQNPIELGAEPEEEPEEPEEAVPEFVPVFYSQPLPEDIIEFITGLSFRYDAPFGHDFLSYLTITHVDFERHNQIGHMIVAAEIADEVLDIFREIFEADFPIHQIRLIDYYNASDEESMAANNSSAFNFRYIAGTTTLSRHALGLAIDINPVQNPYMRGGVVLPPAGVDYLDRENVRPGMIIPGDAVYNAFISRGWTWGGNWTSLLDYHHFERR